MLSKPELIQKQYEEYNNQINLINDVFQRSMGNGNKLKQSEEALKRSSYLLKRSIIATLNDKDASISRDISARTKSLNPNMMNNKIWTDKSPSSISINQNPSSRINEESKGYKMINDLRQIGYSANGDSELTLNRKDYNSNGNTPPSLLSSAFEQTLSETSNNTYKRASINTKELELSKSCFDYQPEKGQRSFKE